MSRSVAVFGSSEPREGDEAYTLARRTGAALAGAGFTVVTGGYGGVMEAASRGAWDAGGRTLGVLTEVFSSRSPNPYLTSTMHGADLYERTRLLIDHADAYVVLAGKTGTLAEVAWVWALARAGVLGEKPLVALGPPWPAVFDVLEAAKTLDPAATAITERAATVEEAMEILFRRLS